MAILSMTEAFSNVVDLLLLVGPRGPHQHKFFVCSEPLSRVSPVLKALVQELMGDRVPPTSDRMPPTSEPTIELAEDSPESVRIILNIAHGRPQKVPQRMKPEALYRLCKFIHKYEIGDILEPWAACWCARLAERPQAWVPQTCEFYAKVVWIGWVLGNRTVISSAAKTMMLTMDSATLVELRKQDPTGIVGHITELQARTVEALVDTITGFWGNLVEPQTAEPRCRVGFSHQKRRQCDAVVLGAFTASLHLEDLFEPEAGQRTHNLGQLRHIGERIAGRISMVRAEGHWDCGPGRQLLEAIGKVLKSAGPLLPERALTHLEGRAEELGITY
ncbi:hypothetical protein RB594_009773 [Gaeumannomyces avenae]